ncbi:hypothetical protein KIH39_19410 [Telmatocola sphagniphila]|uniref:Uncharacterized protein n=1 Tax=Telmatocola sphagniphila TaxID=1123043 RepID=A0A8E6B360_9BACT|nr:hypothetical protein [Telmatocola sphagniphila]QVL31002.1 hypothetical protein KIH39_19410 [Telmatocola sphagniphila]
MLDTVYENYRFTRIARELLRNSSREFTINELQQRGYVSRRIARKIYHFQSLHTLFHSWNLRTSVVNGITEAIELSTNSDKPETTDGVGAYVSCFYLLYVSTEANIDVNIIDSMNAFKLLANYCFFAEHANSSLLMEFLAILRKRLSSIRKSDASDYLSACELCQDFLKNGSVDFSKTEDSDQSEITFELRKHMRRLMQIRC